MDRPLHTDDLVANKSKTTQLAVVERTYADVDTHEPHPERDEIDNLVHDRTVKKAAFRKFLKDGVPPKGTVLVRWHQKPVAELISESKLELVARSLLIGDVVKKNARDAMSGVVINTSTKCTLQPMCDLTISNRSARLKGLVTDSGAEKNAVGLHRRASEIPPPLVNIPTSELKYSEPLTEEELIIYKNHLGRVDAVSSAISIKLSDNGVVEIADDLAEHPDEGIGSFYVGDIACTKKGALRNGRWIYGQYSPNTPPIGTVVATRPVTAEVMWLRRRIGSAEDGGYPPDLLERDELESEGLHVYDRTRIPQRNANEPAPETVSVSEIDIRLGLRVRFKDLSGACVKYDGSTAHGKLPRIDRKDTLGYDINVFDVTNFTTDVTVQWQDLTVTPESSIDLIPDSSIDDEHAAWPGEIAHTLDLAPVPNMPGATQPRKVGVVQTVNASERMATLKWCPKACLQYHMIGSGDSPTIRTLLVRVAGKAGSEQEEVSLYDMEAPGEMNVRRGDIIIIGKDKAHDDPDATTVEDDWVGEIVDTCLDGTLTVRVGAASQVRDINLRREETHVAVRSDGTDEVDAWDDGSDSGIDEEMDMLLGNGTESEHEDDTDASEGESLDLEEEANAKYEDENGMPLDEEDVEDEEWESDVDMTDAPHQTTQPTSHSVTPPDMGKAGDVTRPVNDAVKEAADSPDPYLVLESAAPSSHHYINQPSTENATRMKRTQKEHKILRSGNSLPQGVYVRTWESRLDLLRVLFIGPAETPYAGAPFVIDFYLPSTFPTEPPQAFFHSWTSESGLGGVGRVNPNLYEDGKICLSLLGTWEGSKGEGWNASRSTLLQVIVSLLGLVLVREPYFNEAGYEPLAGLESSKRPSALYNERAFLRARKFIITALAWLKSETGGLGTSLDGLEDVVRWLYKDGKGPKLLEKSILDMENVLEKSENSGEGADGLTIMSKGACISLRRVLDRLKGL
ncbi:hypothetical protein LTR37_002706 [Vermiconidia calcicola]|uniref:Uncharacterized protein n=1 Tax=Vermiconidia calcicola TaxID=1690605 RepID=A0ACC3NT79_9PEZI|nr:hypothetical protein LTR37_002706 [Vermiconidia calcicola]